MLYAVVGAILICGCLVILLGRMVWEAKHVVVQQERLHIQGLPDAWNGTVILFLSDIHRSRLTPSWVEKLRSQYPIEMVLLGGDITERGDSLERVRENMTLLREIAPVYAVHGNHDYKADYRALAMVLRDCGVHMLDNESVWLEKDNQGIWLVGVDDIRSKREQLRMAFSEPRYQPACTFMLVHDPLIIERLSDEPIDLMLAGHTHGGQIRFPWVGALLTHEFYRTYSSGLYTLKGQVRSSSSALTKLFISRGVGTAHIPLRLNCPAEVHIMTLQNNEKHPVTPE